MALRPPLGQVGVAPRSTDDRNGDLARIHSLVALMPEPELRAAVEAFYASEQCRALERALGSPIELLHLAGDFPSELIAEVRAQLSAPGPRLTDAFVGEEVRTAASELIRYWVNALLLAWETLRGGRSALALHSELLLPERRRDDFAGAFAAWEGERQEALTSLLASVAILRSDMLGITRAFSANLHAWASRNADVVELPDGIALRWRGSHPELVQREQARPNR